MHEPISTNVVDIILATPGFSSIMQPIVSMTTLDPVSNLSWPSGSVVSNLVTSDGTKTTH